MAPSLLAFDHRFVAEFQLAAVVFQRLLPAVFVHVTSALKAGAATRNETYAAKPCDQLYLRIDDIP
jgi:hypothetical protein